MVNAVRLAGLFLDRLPRQVLSPETTSDREGFLHPYRIEGGVAETTMRILLRDFDTARSWPSGPRCCGPSPARSRRSSRRRPST